MEANDKSKVSDKKNKLVGGVKAKKFTVYKK